MAFRDFINTKRSTAELETALEVLREFKACESKEEYIVIPFEGWGMFEAYEKFLEEMVNERKQ